MRFQIGELVLYLGRKRVITQIVHVRGKQSLYFKHEGDVMSNAWASECNRVA